MHSQAPIIATATASVSSALSAVGRCASTSPWIHGSSAPPLAASTPIWLVAVPAACGKRLVSTATPVG